MNPTVSIHGFGTGLAQGRTAGGIQRGMTLVELMVALVVVAVLASLSLAGMNAAIGRAKAARSEATIRKVSEVLLPYYEEYETRRPEIPAALVASLLNADPEKESGRVKLAAIKRMALRRLMTLELPERVMDVGVTPGIGASPLEWRFDERIAGRTESYALTEIPPVARRYQSLITAGGVAGIANWDSAELLHMIVTRGPAADPDMIAHFRDDETADTDRDGLPEFIDGWRRPIRFIRWPVGFRSPMQPIDGAIGGVDTLVSTDGHRLVPLIYSAGKDGETGIDDMPSLPYAAPAIRFDPFAFDRVTNRSRVASRPAAAAGSGSEVLVPVRRPSLEAPVTFVACRVTSPGVFQVPPVDGATTVPDAAFQTCGSRTGPAAADNVHNHDMTR